MINMNANRKNYARYAVMFGISISLLSGCGIDQKNENLANASSKTEFSTNVDTGKEDNFDVTVEPMVEDKLDETEVIFMKNPISLKFDLTEQEVGEWLQQQKIAYDVWEDHSNLGDYTNAASFTSVEDLCAASWKEILYLADDFMITFDGPEGTLASIVLQSDAYTTKEGLFVSDTKETMEELYGTDYTRYDDGECGLYEYPYDDGYLVVCIDEETNDIIYIKTDAYSEAEYQVGKKLLDKFVEMDLNRHE